MTAPKQSPFTRLPKWIRWSLLLWLLLGLFPVLCSAFGLRFLPSPEWTAQTRILAIASGLAMAALMTLGVAIGIEISSQRTGRLKKFAVILFAPVMGMFIGSLAISSSVPLMVALAKGADAEIQYTVAEVTEGNSRGCRNPISLEGLPFMTNELCGYPANVISTFARGDIITVTGRGTKWGVFPHSACKSE